MAVGYDCLLMKHCVESTRQACLQVCLPHHTEKLADILAENFFRNKNMHHNVSHAGG
jgi:hypothetical protein